MKMILRYECRQQQMIILICRECQSRELAYQWDVENIWVTDTNIEQKKKKMTTETLPSNLSLFQTRLAQNIFPKDLEAQWVRGIFCFSWSPFYKFAMALKLYKYMYQIYYSILKLKVIIGCSQEWGGWALPGRKGGCSRIICSLWSWNSLKIKRNHRFHSFLH